MGLKNIIATGSSGEYTGYIMTNKIEDCKKWHGGHSSGAVYGFGLIGGLIYYIQHAPSFMDGVWGIFKAIVWPAMLVYKALELLKM